MSNAMGPSEYCHPHLLHFVDGGQPVSRGAEHWMQNASEYSLQECRRLHRGRLVVDWICRKCDLNITADYGTGTAAKLDPDNAVNTCFVHIRDVPKCETCNRNFTRYRTHLYTSAGRISGNTGRQPADLRIIRSGKSGKRMHPLHSRRSMVSGDHNGRPVELTGPSVVRSGKMLKRHCKKQVPKGDQALEPKMESRERSTSRIVEEETSP